MGGSTGARPLSVISDGCINAIKSVSFRVAANHRASWYPDSSLTLNSHLHQTTLTDAHHPIHLNTSIPPPIHTSTNILHILHTTAYRFLWLEERIRLSDPRKEFPDWLPNPDDGDENCSDIRRIDHRNTQPLENSCARPRKGNVPVRRNGCEHSACHQHLRPWCRPDSATSNPLAVGTLLKAIRAKVIEGPPVCLPVAL